MANATDRPRRTGSVVLFRLSILFMSAALGACAAAPEATAPAAAAPVAAPPAAAVTPAANPAAELVPVRPQIYAPFRLTADLSSLSPEERRMLGLFIDAAQIMDDLFWKQAYGDRDRLLNGIGDPRTRQFAEINYGPWDRLEDNRPFVPGVGAKPEGAAFYPPDMSREEFERAQLPGKDSLYTFITRDPNGALALLPYGFRFAAELRQAASLLNQAAALATDAGLRNYLELRADALTSDDYRASDMAWLDMKDNRIDLVIGPIETYEDRLFGYKAAYEAYVLVKDMAWSKRLARYAAMLPDLQRGLPVPDAYKAEAAGSDSDLNAYDVIYYAGDCNSGSKTIAINLPNDEQVQLAKGTRRLQLKNAMRAKFEKILAPIAAELIAEDQRRHVTFDAFFADTMFHEVAHGLGIKNTINGKGTVREALKDRAGALEEGKADVLGLYMITKLHERGELQGSLEDYYVTFLAGHVPLGEVRRRVRAWRGQHGALQLFRRARRLCARRGERTLSRRHAADARGGRRAVRADPAAAGRWRLRCRDPAQRKAGPDRPAAARRSRPAGGARDSRRRGLRAGQVGARPRYRGGAMSAVERVIEGRPRDLGGFTVRRLLPASGRRTIGPFIFFDHMGPATFAEGAGVDVRPHPHIGLATVTYLFEGELMHRDSLGSEQVIRPGDVNWMVAGRGIVHSERTPPRVTLRRAGLASARHPDLGRAAAGRGGKRAVVRASPRQRSAGDPPHRLCAAADRGRGMG